MDPAATHIMPADANTRHLTLYMGRLKQRAPLPALLDPADWEQAVKYCWHLHSAPNGYCVRMNVKYPTGKWGIVALAQMIASNWQLEATNPLVREVSVRHINGDGLDNRRSNLMPVLRKVCRNRRSDLPVFEWSSLGRWNKPSKYPRSVYRYIYWQKGHVDPDSSDGFRYGGWYARYTHPLTHEPMVGPVRTTEEWARHDLQKFMDKVTEEIKTFSDPQTRPNNISAQQLQMLGLSHG